MTQQSHCWAYTPRKPELRDTCILMFIAALFTIARTWKQPRCPSADEWIRKLWYIIQNGIVSSLQLGCEVMSDSLQSHEQQHDRPPCLSPTPGVYPSPCPLSWWCHPTISSSFVPFSSCPQSFPTLGPFQMSQLFASGGQSIGVSVSTSVLPMNTQDWSPLGWTCWISL